LDEGNGLHDDRLKKVPSLSISMPDNLIGFSGGMKELSVFVVHRASPRLRRIGNLEKTTMMKDAQNPRSGIDKISTASYYWASSGLSTNKTSRYLKMAIRVVNSSEEIPVISDRPMKSESIRDFKGLS
jgi:hypothetical protein